MIIHDMSYDDRTGTMSAQVSWEEGDHPQRALAFEVEDLQASPSAEAFLTAVFPIAASMGERRVRLEDASPCPMLVEGLRTAYAWWEGWGGMSGLPTIESGVQQWRGGRSLDGDPRAVSLVSGGVDGLHLLMNNRRIYRSDDPAYIRDAIFVHGFDIGRDPDRPEDEYFRNSLSNMIELVGPIGVRVVTCRTNLRHLPTIPDLWYYRHHGAALAAVGHASTVRRSLLFIASTHTATQHYEFGSHAAVDGLFSSQRVRVVHEGVRFSRLQKIRDLALHWPEAVDRLRVCPSPTRTDPNVPNCGRCEKCLRTRLELLVAGVSETRSLGPSLTPIELWDVTDPEAAEMYDELLPPLKRMGLLELHDVIQWKVASRPPEARWPNAPLTSYYRHRASVEGKT